MLLKEKMKKTITTKAGKIFVKSWRSTNRLKEMPLKMDHRFQSCGSKRNKVKWVEEMMRKLMKVKSQTRTCVR